MALELGPCQVVFDSEDIGKTLGGVIAKFSDDTQDLKSDQYGSSAEDTIITGSNAEIEVPLAEIDFSKIAFALNKTVFGTNAGVAGTNSVGTSLKAKGKELILKKYVDGAPSTDEADWITFPLAAPKSDVELSFNAEDQRVLKVTFKAFPSAVTANWGAATTSAQTVLYFFGDSAATS